METVSKKVGRKTDAVLLSQEDLIRVLQYLLDDGNADLRRSPLCAALEPRLRKLLEELQAPAVAPMEAPPELASTFEEHTALGKGIWFTLRGWATKPRQRPDLAEAVARVQAVVMPQEPNGREMGVDRKRRALVVKEALPALADVWEVFPELVDGGTLRGDVERWIALAVECAHLENAHRVQRSVFKSRSKERTHLRPRTLRMLLTMRRELRRELEEDPALPRDLETRLFELFDRLGRRAAASADAAERAEERKAQKKAATPVADDTGGDEHEDEEDSSGRGSD